MELPLLRAIADGSTEAIVVVNDKKKIEYVNGQFCVLFGYRSDKILGNSLDSVPNLALVAKRIENDLNALREFPSRSTFTLSGDELSISESCSIHIDYVTIDGSLHCITRFSPESYGYVSLLPSELDPTWIIESLLDGVAIVDEKGHFTYVNPAFCQMINRSSKDLIGKRWVDFTSLPDEDIVYEKVALRRIGEAERYEVEWKLPDDSLLPTYVSAAPFHDKAGSFKGSISVITDITELKDHENALKFYISLLTHDIPNQLQVVLTAAGLIDTDLPPSYVEEARVTITEAVERCNRLIVKVRRAAKMRDLPIREMNLSEVLREKIRAVERVYQAKVHLDNFDESVMIRANTLLGELLWNLLENAARHNPKPNRHIWVRGKPENEYFSISIEDNGPGISDAKKEILFDVTRRTGGVGLTLVDRMIKECGGWIEVHDRVEGRPDQGSKFILYFPLAE